MREREVGVRDGRKQRNEGGRRIAMEKTTETENCNSLTEK